jgi:fatty acid desaturase
LNQPSADVLRNSGIDKGEKYVKYRPLAEVRKDLRVKWYRSPIEFAKQRELSKRSDLQGWFQAGGHLLLFAFTGTLAYLFWSQKIWLGFLLALFVHGTVASFFVGVASHELGHGSVFRTKWLNKVFLYLFSLLGWWNPFDYANSHTYHHRYTLYPEGDRENLLPLNPNLRWSLLLQLFTVNLFTQPGRTFSTGGLFSTILHTTRGASGGVGSTDIPFNEWLQALHTDRPGEHRKAIRWSRILLLFHGSVLVVSIVTGLWVLPLIISFSVFIGNWGVYFLGMTQHCGLRTEVSDFRKSTRSIKINPLAEFLYWHMNWHIEHHMYVGIPCYNLEKLSQEIADDMPEPRTLVEAWREMHETWRRQQTEPNYEFDTPLPATVTS